MKVIYSTILILICFTVYGEELTFVSDIFCPYSCDGNEQGFMMEIVRNIYEPEGHKVVFIIEPWSRAKINVKNGLYSCLLGSSKSDRIGLFYSEEEIAEMKGCFYIRKEFNWKFSNIQSLKKLKLGLIQGYGYEDAGKEFADFLESNKAMINYVKSKKGYIQNFLMLLYKRIDVTLTDKNVAAYWLKKSGKMKEQIKEAGCFNIKFFMYAGFTPANPNSKKYARMFDQGIKKLRKSGKLKVILSKYGVKDWK